MAAHQRRRSDVLSSIENSSSDLTRCATPSIGYQWYNSSDPLKERQFKTEVRRQQILEAIYSEEDYSVSISEWLALQSERDRLLKLSFDQENEQVKKEFVKDLRQVLYDIPHFSNSKEDQDVFQSVIGLKLQLADYAHTNNITSPPPLNPSQGSLRNREKEDIDGVTSTSLPPPPPPPPPPLPPVSLPIIPTQADILTHSTTTEGVIRKVGFLEELNGINIKDSLRRVNIPRTPGGTPHRPKHRIPIDSSNHGDLIQRALLNKFHHLRTHSTPTAITASPGFADTSNSMEISSAWSEHYASDPDLTRINSTDGPPSNASRGRLYNDPSISSPSTALSPTPLTPTVLSPTTPSQYHRNLTQYSTSV